VSSKRRRADFRVGAPESVAAGRKAVEISTAFALGEMEPVRTSRVLGRLNQARGFDCPGCAWSEAEHRSATEFCENRAKVAAWGATTKTVDAAFFARHSVDDLQQRQDHWLEAQGSITSAMHLKPSATHYSPISWADALSELVLVPLDSTAAESNTPTSKSVVIQQCKQ